MHQTLFNNKWEAFKPIRFHCIDINKNSLCPKIEELIVCNAAVIGNSESKLDNSIFDFGIEVDDYNNLCFDINRNAGWVEIAL